MTIHLVQDVECHDSLCSGKHLKRPDSLLNNTRTYLRLYEVAKCGAGLEPIRLSEMFAELLHALIESHVRDGFLVEHVKQVF